jgi:hypothetical protein
MPDIDKLREEVFTLAHDFRKFLWTVLGSVDSGLIVRHMSWWQERMVEEVVHFMWTGS